MLKGYGWVALRGYRGVMQIGYRVAKLSDYASVSDDTFTSFDGFSVFRIAGQLIVDGIAGLLTDVEKGKDDNFVYPFYDVLRIVKTTNKIYSINIKKVITIVRLYRCLIVSIISGV